MDAVIFPGILMMNRSQTTLAREPRTKKPAPLSYRQRFLNACDSLAVDRPPIWLMRQAGRCLPEYRAMKEKYSFLQLVQTPELATEVTLQPIRRFGFDAAILFSDILVVPEAMGQAYSFAEKGGIQMQFSISDAAAIDKLRPENIEDRLKYIPEALKLIRRELGNRTALLGFAGSPWTLANFMLEGGSAREYTRAKQLFYTDRPLFDRLFNKLSQAVTSFLQMQIDAGVDAIQIFDSLGGLLAHDAFEEASAKWIRSIIAALKGNVPVIVFSKGTHGNWTALAETGADVLGIDWTVPLWDVKAMVGPRIAVQGNLDPMLLTTTPETVAREAHRILTEMSGVVGYIFNLGHGVPPNATVENIETLVETVRSFVPYA
jgi:uroporphyrinogen decarboxylase